MRVVIKEESLGHIAYDENGKEIGRCMFVPHEEATYCSVYDKWGDGCWSTEEFLKACLRGKYKYEPIEFVSNE